MAQSHEGHDHVWADDLTRNQELVLGTLAHSDAPLSAYDILDRLRDDGLRAPLQVYRALEKLTESAGVETAARPSGAMTSARARPKPATAPRARNFDIRFIAASPFSGPSWAGLPSVSP